MSEFSSFRPLNRPALVLLLAASLVAGPVSAQGLGAARNGDYIVAIVNQELVTAGEVDRRIAQIRESAERSGSRLPGGDELRQRVVEQLIEERVLVTHARDSGMRIDEVELDRAVAGVAQQNQVTVPQLRERLQSEGIAFSQFRDQIRDQMLAERVREREVLQSIRVSDAEVDGFLTEHQRQQPVELNLAQILIPVPEQADEAQIAPLRAQAEQALARVRGGEDFATVAREVSQDSNREQGGEIGLRPATRLPDVFVNHVTGLAVGAIAPTLLQSGAGFHVLKLVERRDGSLAQVTQTHARHILLRTSEQLDEAAAVARLAGFKREIESGAASFEDLARSNSQDGSAPQGGDLGWAGPGQFVPEFEAAMDALPLNGLSDPVVSRFGVHLIQVLERRSVEVDQRQLREQARNVLRERKFESAYEDWAADLRARAYVEMREPPQ